MKRSLMRGLLIALLLPVLLIAQPRLADAATTYGDPVNWSWDNSEDVSSIGGDSRVDCTGSGFWSVPSTGSPLISLRSINCSTGFNVSGFRILSITASGSGPGCTFTGGFIGEVDGNPGPHSATLTPGAYDESCSVTDLCISFEQDSHSNPWSSPNETACVLWPLGQAPSQTPPTACDWIDPGLPDVVTVLDQGNGTYIKIVYKGSLKGKPAGNFKAYGMYRTNAQSPPTASRLSDPKLVPFGQTIGPWSGETANLFLPKENGIRNTLVGVGLYFEMTGTATGYYQSGATGSIWNGTQGVYGANDPVTCRFYWGEKFTSVPGNDTDEPAGPYTWDEVPGGDVEPTTDPPPPVADNSCAGFSFTDPGSWAAAGVCAIVRTLLWMAGILERVVSAVAAIVPAIANLLDALFIPDAGSWGFDGLLDQFKTRPPGSVVMGLGDGIQSFIDGYSGSGCGLLADFSSDDVPGATLTCSNVQSVPGYSALYTLVQMGMLGLTGLSVFRTMAGKVGGDDG